MVRPGLRIWRSGVRISSGAPIANVVAAPLCAIEAPQHSLALLTVGADKNYDTADFVAGCRERGCTPHVSQNDTNRRSAIDARTTRHPGYHISTIKRKRIEEPFGWIMTVGGLRKTRHRGRDLVEWFFVLTASATISFAFRRCWQQRDESVWSVKHETKPQRKLRVRRRLRPIDWLILAAHIRKIALQDPFFSSLLPSLASCVSRKADVV
jgi:hypothetical protein